MQINPVGKYYPDRTYSNNAGKGTIRVKSKSLKLQNDKKPNIIYFKNNKQCFNHSLISTRKTKYGYSIIVVRQLETSNKSYNLAKNFQTQAKEELRKNNYFLNDYDGFLEWFSEKEKVLKENGFHKLRG